MNLGELIDLLTEVYNRGFDESVVRVSDGRAVVEVEVTSKTSDVYLVLDR